ncbi:two-component response regulator-like PRR1 [Forsythia ovata]|uniref:Two-component response regulator-like PRR1 n=1 Tax=Forsythia ovata TaxID=205694 RepID=A0ABD1RGI8_9LAMI
MYGQHGNEYTSMEFLAHFSLQDTTTPHLTYPPPTPLQSLAIPGNEYDSVSALKSEIGYSSSGCSNIGSPNSITSTYGPYSPTLMQRSISSQSPHKNFETYYSPMNNSSLPGFSEPDTSSVRKVLNTGDLQGVRLAQHKQSLNISIANEVSIIEGMNKACRYSPEEKKERIERYRNKRNLRNFNKKIKYECRKTLAESRPRIRGRFTRNDEIEKTTQNQLDHAGVEEDDDNWINFLNAFSANMMP